ncbi:MAG TPA: protein kinase [Ktedonobacterales bacterium]
MGLPPGTLLARRYRVRAQLGEGGMGSVYQVEDLRRAGAVYAAKELLDEPGASAEDLVAAHKRFSDEIALMRTLSHPALPSFVESFADGGRQYFVMEFIPGANLEERLARTRAPIAEADALRWTITVCDVLTYLHTHRPSIIVRDLKPGNIMVTPNGEARLIDLGIARTYKHGKLSNTENLGTMTYASPEHLGQTQTDARSDIYSLGATLFHLLTNHEPKPLETPAPGSLRRIQPTISEATERAVIRAMQLDPSKRFQSAAQMRSALASALAPLVPKQTPSTRVVLPAGAASTRVVPAVKPAPSAAPPVPVTRAALTQSARICPRCGYLNRAGAKFCAHDGARLGAAAAANGDAAMAARAAASARPAPAVSAPVSRVDTSASLTSSLQRAREAFDAGKFATAIRLAATATQTRNDYDLSLLLGYAYAKSRQPLDAAGAFAKAAQLRPTVEALTQEGLAYRNAAHPAEAQVALTQARQLDPRDPELAYLLAMTCIDLGQLAQAEGELQEALKQRPQDARAQVGLGRIAAARKRWPEAIDWFEKAIAADGSLAEARLELGRAYMSQRNFAGAIRALEPATRLAPDDADAYTALGVCYHAIGRRGPARTALRRAIALDGQNSEASELLKHM